MFNNLIPRSEPLQKREVKVIKKNAAGQKAAYLAINRHKRIYKIRGRARHKYQKPGSVF
jgi:hypothetical protein